MLFRPLDIDQIKIFVSSFSAGIGQFLDVAPGPRSVTKTRDLGGKSSVFIKVTFTGGLVGSCVLGWSESSACAVAARMHQTLWKESASFDKVSPEVHELLVEFASHLINHTVESFKERGINCSAIHQKVGSSREAQSGGHEFLMTSFPLAEMGQMELFLALKVALSREQAGKRIMIVDDSASLRGMLRCLLEDAGYLVVGEATNGREAITMAGDLSPDLVTMDIEMPDINGIQALAAIKVRYPGIKVIMVSYLTDREKVHECISKGAENYILKPYEPVKVVEAVARALG